MCPLCDHDGRLIVCDCPPAPFRKTRSPAPQTFSAPCFGHQREAAHSLWGQFPLRLHRARRMLSSARHKKKS